ncbi:MAG TPA: surface lipoprotein assembly modifier [Allosphingosinicella sp.]|jgi:tetratricopeptide (TPR) repeat protein|nr:surface lipoprotein assembly modifier [Allosphingosinicella sp.]
MIVRAGGRGFRIALAAAMGVVAIAPGPARAQQKITGLSAVQLFDAAERAKQAGRTADALALYDALTRDPDAEIRAEARFRRGMLLADLHRYSEAAQSFRALLDEKPNAARVRLELARVLALMGDVPGARRSLRQAQAAGLPPDVALVVNQYANALRSPKLLGGSFELALAPDTNINRATASRTLDTIIAPLTLSSDARAHSGIGIEIGGQAYARIPLDKHLSLLPRVSVGGNLYRESAFNDVSASALVGLEWQGARDRLTPSLGPTWRWFGDRLYARTATANLGWIHGLNKRTELTGNASVSRVRYRANDLQDGMIYDANLGIERALTARSGIGISVSGTRQTARDPGYATASGGLSVFGWREAGKTTLFASAAVHRLEGDARLFLFPDRRKEWLYHATIGATLRQVHYKGFSPVVRLSWERNVSTVGLYDYRRLAANIGITRAF